MPSLEQRLRERIEQHKRNGSTDLVLLKLAEDAADLIARLPVTADGVPPTHCATVYYRHATVGGDVQAVKLDAPGGMLEGETDPEEGWVPLSECYSTRAAAESAGKGGA